MTKRLFFAFWLFFMLGCFVRNLPSGTEIKKLFQPFDTYVLSKLGFFHRGWGMFPGPTTGSMEMRLEYHWPDGTDSHVVYFPIFSNFSKSVWNEVMEDLGVRDDNGDHENMALKGFYRYECKNKVNPATGQNPIRISVQKAWPPLHELHSNFGKPYFELKHTTINSYECEINEFKKFF